VSNRKLIGPKRTSIAPVLKARPATDEDPSDHRAALERNNADFESRLAERTIERDHVARVKALTELARTNAELERRLAERTVERDDVARDEALTELARTNDELELRLAERTIERDDVARDEALAELGRTNAELKSRLAARTIERDDVARDEALAELARTNAELKQRLAERTIERDDVARDEALAELARTNAELKARLAERTIERDDVARDEALAELNRTNAELKARLAERTIERDDIARDEALAELARTNAELKARLAERTIERDNIARGEALAELGRTNAQLKQRLAERTIERDDVARDDALAELGRTNAHLKRRLAERTVERDSVAKQIASTELTRTNAAEEQLRLHAAELESLNADLESFSYSVSHDLRAPVRAVLGYIRAIEEDCAGELGAEGRRLLTVVEREASRMGNLIDDLLAFSRLGRQPMLSASVDMTSLATDAAAEQPSLRGTTPLAIPDLPSVRGDRVLLRQVWVNLISNAVKYASKRERPEITVWATAAGAFTEYHVRDNGVGFDMRYADKLFGVFQRLHRADEFPGTGVGLAIVMRIVQRHGGTVRADAKLGEGATFTFALPNGSVA
jgi:signal transduction histidine kinase